MAPYIIQTDASNKGLGFVICQEVDNELRTIKSDGRVLSKSGLNYDTATKELLTIYFCVKENEVCSMNSNFIVYYDHKPLVNLKAFKNILSTALLEWILRGNERKDKLSIRF